MNEKAKQILGELEMLGERSDLWYKDFWITRSPIGGYTVVSVKRTITEHFSNAQRVVDFLSKNDIPPVDKWVAGKDYLGD